ncbi:MAG: metallophosphoesterase [Traorella sp.]
MNKYARLKKVSFNQYSRILVMSDLHGDDEGFQQALQELAFCSSDALVIVGDILEKGPQSLKLLQEIMNYSKQGNVYIVAGNNDVIFEEWKNDEISLEDVKWYMHSRENSILIEMANHLHLNYETLEDIQLLKETIFKEYQNEIHFLSEIPEIIESETTIFVHAGIENKPLDKQDVNTCLTAWEFAKTNDYFEKMVVVGHWPASNYCEDIICVNPYYNPSNNIISIDGGNSMKSWQQINVLIFEKGQMEIKAIDRCPKIKLLEEQEASKDALSLIFPHTELTIKEKKEKESLCYLPYVNKEMMIQNNQIYEYKGKTYCYDFTTYCLGVKKGEIVSYCEELDDSILIKRNGIVGKYYGTYEKM